MITFYINPNATREYRMATVEGEATTVRVNWAAKTGYDGTSVSSVVWAVDGSATVSGAAEAADVASALVTTASAGVSVIKVTATMADNQIDVAVIKVFCASIPGSNGDYE